MTNTQNEPVELLPESIGRRIEGIGHVIHGIADRCDDEGDRIYLGSTNDQHTLVRQARYLAKIAVQIAALSTKTDRRPWCETCGKDVHEILCPTCAKWWNDNPPPAESTTTDPEQAVMAERELPQKKTTKERLARYMDLKAFTAVKVGKEQAEKLKARREIANERAAAAIRFFSKDENFRLLAAIRAQGEPK